MDLTEITRRMHGALASFKGELTGLRTGRASSSLLDPIVVHVYGSSMPLNQVASVSVPEPRMLSVQVWDKSNVSAVDRAIREANLGLNPIVDGALLRVPIPDLTADRRKELVKIAHKYAEQARVVVRHVRRDGIDNLKKAEKSGGLGEDEMDRATADIQKLTDGTIADIDRMLADKEAGHHARLRSNDFMPSLAEQQTLPAAAEPGAAAPCGDHGRQRPLGAARAAAREGHRRGVEAVRRTVRAAIDLGIGHMTLSLLRELVAAAHRSRFPVQPFPLLYPPRRAGAAREWRQD